MSNEHSFPWPLDFGEAKALDNSSVILLEIKGRRVAVWAPDDIDKTYVVVAEIHVPGYPRSRRDCDDLLDVYAWLCELTKTA